MDGARFRRLPRLLRSRGFAIGLWAIGCSGLGSGCDSVGSLVQQAPPSSATRGLTASQGAAASKWQQTTGPGVVQSAYQEAAPPPTRVASELPKVVASEPKQVPINLDTVLRLAEEQNAQIGIAREKVNESLAENDVAARGWLPKVYAGVGYFRHEGGIQNPDGTFVHSSFGSLYPGLDIQSELDLRAATYDRVNAERKVLEQKGELSKVTTETLVEATETYFDLLTARRAEAVLRDLDRYHTDLLKRATDLQKEVGDVLVEGVRGEMAGRKQALAKLHQQGDAASAKLVYLLGLAPQTQLVPMDDVPAPIQVVDATPEPATLVDHALTSGPGVRELQSLLGTLQSGMAQLEGPQRFVPKFCLSANEGAFGAGPGSRMEWDNRLDIGLAARWNLTEFLSARELRRVAASRMQQAQLSYQDLRGKLALSVEEARTAILSGQEQIKTGQEQIQHTGRSLDLSEKRLQENVAGASTTEVLQSLRGLEAAHINYLQAIAAHNKAQIRLMLLLGPAACGK
jgi:outer membrane protein TolC